MPFQKPHRKHVILAGCIAATLTACGGGGGSSGSSAEESNDNSSMVESPRYTIATEVSDGGSAELSANTAEENTTVELTLTADNGYALTEVSGCGGSLVANLYTTAPLTEDCTISAVFSPAAELAYSELALTVESIKTFTFSWQDTTTASHYRVLENSDGLSGFSQLGDDIPAGEELARFSLPLYDRINARYLLQTCYDITCVDSDPVMVNNALSSGIGYFKASNSDASDEFGSSMALSADGTTMAVGAIGEQSNSIGVNGIQSDNTAGSYTGAVFIYVLENGQWQQQAYIKASNSEAGDYFGFSVALSDNGNSLAVGALEEDSDSNEINGNQANNNAQAAGAVYIYSRDSDQWQQEAYLKASNSGQDHWFGWQVAFDASGSLLVVGAPGEDGNSFGINGNQTDKGADLSGAAYVFERSSDTWQQSAYIKASNSSAGDFFGISVAVNGDGNTLAIGANNESSGATGVNNNQNDDSLQGAGAVYIFNKTNTNWSQSAYIKPNTIREWVSFGSSVALNLDGTRLAVSATHEKSASSGINGEESDESLPSAGAAYIFDLTNGQWQQSAYLKDQSPVAYDNFGFSISMDSSGTLLAVGSPQDSNEGNGKVSVFKRSGSSWSLLTNISPPNTEFNEDFGFAVSLSNDGKTLSITDQYESSGSTGINPSNTSGQEAYQSGAIYLY